MTLPANVGKGGTGKFEKQGHTVGPFGNDPMVKSKWTGNPKQIGPK